MDEGQPMHKLKMPTNLKNDKFLKIHAWIHYRKLKNQKPTNKKNKQKLKAKRKLQEQTRKKTKQIIFKGVRLRSDSSLEDKGKEMMTFH